MQDAGQLPRGEGVGAWVLMPAPQHRQEEPETFGAASHGGPSPVYPVTAYACVSCFAYPGLVRALGLPPRRPRVYDTGQMLALPDTGVHDV